MLLMKVNVCEKHQLCMAFSKPHQLTTSLSQKGSSFCFFGKAENTFIIFYRVSDLYNKDHKGVKHVRIYGRDEDDTPSFAF